MARFAIETKKPNLVRRKTLIYFRNRTWIASAVSKFFVFCSKPTAVASELEIHCGLQSVFLFLPAAIDDDSYGKTGEDNGDPDTSPSCLSVANEENWGFIRCHPNAQKRGTFNGKPFFFESVKSIFIDLKYKKTVESCQYIADRILQIQLKVGQNNNKQEINGMFFFV